MDLKRLKFDTPAVYSIRVLGTLDAKWTDYFGGLTIKTDAVNGEGRTVITTMTGQMVDQAELLGLLNALYSYHCALLSVECENC